MRSSLCLLLVAGCLSAQQGAILFEGARLITGDGSAPIENSAFLIENNKFTKVGKKGDVQLPAGAVRINLTGKTVMPSLIDTHTHLGWQIIKTGAIGVDTYSKENLIDHLQRLAYYGIAATRSMGIDKGEIPYQVRADPGPNAALFGATYGTTPELLQRTLDGGWSAHVNTAEFERAYRGVCYANSGKLGCPVRRGRERQQHTVPGGRSRCASFGPNSDFARD